MMKGAIFGKTRWKRASDAEAELAKRLSIAPALYVNLQKLIDKEEAYGVMEKICISCHLNEYWHLFNTLTAPEECGMTRLMAFIAIIESKGSGRLNEREYIKKTDTICHYIITRCVLHEFFTEAETPELTYPFCKADDEFYNQAFPSIRFHRGYSPQNTLAYGNERCEFIFEKKNGDEKEL